MLRASALGVLDAEGAYEGAADGVVTGQGTRIAKVAAAFVEAIAQHRHWARERSAGVPA